MARRPKPEEIISKLRKIEIRLSQGAKVPEAVRSIGVSRLL